MSNNLSYTTDLSKVNIIDQQRAFAAVASAIGREYKLKFKLVDNGSNDTPVYPHTMSDGTVVLPALRTDATKEDVIRFWAAFWHEVGHHDPAVNDVFPLIHELNLNTYSAHGMVLNILDDSRVDFNKIDEFLGKQEAIELGFCEILKAIQDQEIFSKEQQGQLHTIALATTLVDWGVRGSKSVTFKEAHKYITSDEVSKLHPDIKGMVDTLESNKDIMDRWHNIFTMTAKEEWELTKDIVAALDVEEPNNGCSSGGSEDQSDDDADEGNGEGTGEYKGGEYSKADQEAAASVLNDIHEQGKANGETNSNDGEGEESSDSPGEKEARDISNRDQEKSRKTIPYQQQSSEQEAGSVQNSTDIDIDYSTYDKQKQAKTYSDGVAIVNIEDPQNPVVLKGSTDGSKYSRSRGTGNHPLVGEVLRTTGRAVNVARKKLQVLLRTRYLKNQRKGKLNGSSLYKIKTNKSKKPTIYKQRVNHKQEDCRISILIDNSGSMSGVRQESAFKSALYLSNLCTAMRVPYEVAFFTDLGYSLTYFITKSFSTKVIPDDKLSGQLYILEYSMGSNSDGDYVKIAYERLVSSGNEARKVLFVVSDGQPASNRSDCDEVGLLEDTVRMIENDPKVDILGIGVETDYVKDYYKNFRVLDDSTDLENCVIDLIVDSIAPK